MFTWCYKVQLYVQEDEEISWLCFREGGESVKWDVYRMFWIKTVAWWQLKGNRCVFPPKERIHFSLKILFTGVQCLARAQQAFSTDLILLTFFLPWKKEREKIILYPKTGREKGVKPSGNNQDLIVEAYFKSANNLTAELVHSAFIELNDFRILHCCAHTVRTPVMGSRGLMVRVGLVTRRSQVRVSGPAGIVDGGSE